MAFKGGMYPKRLDHAEEPYAGAFKRHHAAIARWFRLTSLRLTKCAW